MTVNCLDFLEKTKSIFGHKKLFYLTFFLILTLKVIIALFLNLLFLTLFDEVFNSIFYRQTKLLLLPSQCKNLFWNFDFCLNNYILFPEIARNLIFPHKMFKPAIQQFQIFCNCSSKWCNFVYQIYIETLCTTFLFLFVTL